MTVDPDALAYADEVKQQFYTGHAREHAYRPALKRLMGSFEDTTAVNDPRRSQHGNPDFVFLKKSNTSIIKGYAEAKDITVDLIKTVKTEQLRRYAGYDKLFLTNYIDFRFFRNGKQYEEISIGKIQNNHLIFNLNECNRLKDILQEFLERAPESIKSGKQLAQIMGGKARRIRDNVSRYLGQEAQDKNAELEKIYDMMRELLVHDLTTEKFADMYAQTLVYGLFVARYNDTTPDDFSRKEARDLVPASNPFLREFFDHIVGPRFDDRLSIIVDELCDAFAVSNVKILVRKHLRLFEIEDEKDPIIHFYEDFLKEYDPDERKKMGAYYTPIPVVRFIINQVDEILKRDFGLAKGLSDTTKIEHVATDSGGRRYKFPTHKVQILDPAVGTATFLNEVIKFVHKDFAGQEGRWPLYAKEELLPRLHGFELMMAPYTIAHLKLGMTLQETGITDIKERLGVFLTNTLEEGVERQQDLFTFGLAEAVSREANEASKIKHEKPIMIIIGNPPYSGVSSNNTDFASNLIKKYKYEPGGQAKLKDRNPKWINNDYVKFIAFAEEMVLKNGEGIVAMITDHGYLDNKTFRGMRWRLAKSFDSIFVLDLHGNSKKQEKAPDGGKDENIFDIMQGVSILLAVKTGKKSSRKLADVYHSEIYGKRKDKFVKLRGLQEWSPIALDSKMYYFAAKNIEGSDIYEKYISLEDLFIQNSLGYQTHRDNLAIQYSKEAIDSLIQELTNYDKTDDDIMAKYKIANSASWNLSNTRRKLRETYDQSLVIPTAYRPFDIRWTYYDESISDRPRKVLKTNYLNKDNLSLEISKQVANLPWRHVFVSNLPAESCLVSNRTKEGNYCFPLYLYHDNEPRTPNFKPEVLKSFTQNLKINYEPEDIFDYIYAFLHSPNYREKYKEFLKTDFPRVLTPKNDAHFAAFARNGKQLRKLHLMDISFFDKFETTYPVAGSNVIEDVKYYLDNGSDSWNSDNGGAKVFGTPMVAINDLQGFGNVPEAAWNLYIGAYQPAQKWLKDRKGQELTNQDINHYQKIIKILTRTSEIMVKIDELEL